jgi:hypothetical protein
LLFLVAAVAAAALEESRYFIKISKLSDTKTIAIPHHCSKFTTWPKRTTLRRTVTSLRVTLTVIHVKLPNSLMIEKMSTYRMFLRKVGERVGEGE